MKKIFLLTAFSVLVLGSVSFAQVSFGPKLGMGLSKFLDVKRPSEDQSYDYSYIVVPQVGVLLNAQLGDHFALRPELLYTQRGTSAKSSTIIFGDTYNYTGNIRISYLELPINFVGSLKAGTGNVELFAGPSLALVLGGKSKEEVNGPSLHETRDGNVIAGTQPEGYYDFGNNKNTYFNPFHVSLNFGAGYKFDNGLLIQLGYNLGLSNLSPHFEDSSEEDKRKDRVVKSNAFTLGIAYLFGGKK